MSICKCNYGTLYIKQSNDHFKPQDVELEEVILGIDNQPHAC